VVLKAVKHGGSLHFASKELLNDKELVLEAVKKNCYALLLTSEELKNDKEFILESLKQNSNSFLSVNFFIYNFDF
jgi:hypothetical protein